MRGFLRPFALTVLLVLFLPACKEGSEISRLSDPKVNFAATHASCKGARQSPINLSNPRTPTQKTLLSTSYQTSSARTVNGERGATVEIQGGTLTFEGQTYRLRRIEVRTPSEHTLDGERYAAEIQLVHRTGDERAVLSILTRKSNRPHEGLDKWVKEDGSSFRYNVGRLLPARRSYYAYDGSLTRPPCREPVRWIVMDTPLRASGSQIETLETRYARPARPLQSRQNRSLVHVAP